MSGMSIELGPRDQEALLEIMMQQGTSIGDAINLAKDAVELRRALERVVSQLRLLDAIEGSRPASRADADGIIEFVSQWRDEALMDTETSEKHQREYEEGDNEWGFPGLTRKQNIAEWRREILNSRQEAASCDAILTALGPEAVTA